MTQNKLKILVVGQAQLWDVIYPFKKAFESLGCRVVMIDPSEYYSVSLWNRILNRIFMELARIKKRWGVRIYFGTKNFNKAIIEKAKEIHPNIVLFDNTIFIKPNTVISFQGLGAKVFAWQNHDILDFHNTSKDFYKTIPLFDCHFTTKSYRFQEFRKFGAKRVVFSPFASDTDLYYPEKVPEEEKKRMGADIVFIGSYYEKYRANLLDELCKLGYDLKVYGNRWGRCGCKCLKRKALMFRPAEGDEYRKVMNASKIALGLLAKVIPEQHTHRTFEIPACGTFMLHERTPEAMSFFKEGEEAEFFDSFEELVKKIDFYLKNEKERKKIAEAGHKRATSYEHSYRARAQKILDVHLSLKNEDNDKRKF